jgi:hypothetical protein
MKAKIIIDGKECQNYEKIKRACQIANPRLLELSFGCEIEVAGHYACPCSIETVLHQSDEKVVLHGRTNPLPKVKISKILGHEPQLFDIKTMMEYNGHAVEQNFLDIVQNWNYPDRLSDQSDVTIKLILPYVQKNG